jgi:hypothetical protein
MRTMTMLCRPDQGGMTPRSRRRCCGVGEGLARRHAAISLQPSAAVIACKRGSTHGWSGHSGSDLRLVEHFHNSKVVGVPERKSSPPFVAVDLWFKAIERRWRPFVEHFRVSMVDPKAIITAQAKFSGFPEQTVDPFEYAGTQVQPALAGPGR